MAESLQQYIDQIVNVITNDGRSVVGLLRGYDRHINLVLDECHERVYSPDAGMEQVPLGLFVIRGHNVALVGEVDMDKDLAVDYKNTMAEPMAPKMSGQYQSPHDFLRECDNEGSRVRGSSAPSNSFQSPRISGKAVPAPKKKKDFTMTFVAAIAVIAIAVMIGTQLKGGKSSDIHTFSTTEQLDVESYIKRMRILQDENVELQQFLTTLQNSAVDSTSVTLDQSKHHAQKATTLIALVDKIHYVKEKLSENLKKQSQTIESAKEITNSRDQLEQEIKQYIQDQAENAHIIEQIEDIFSQSSICQLDLYQLQLSVQEMVQQSTEAAERVTECIRSLEINKENQQQIIERIKLFENQLETRSEDSKECEKALNERHQQHEKARDTFDLLSIKIPRITYTEMTRQSFAKQDLTIARFKVDTLAEFMSKSTISEIRQEIESLTEQTNTELASLDSETNGQSDDRMKLMMGEMKNKKQLEVMTLQELLHSFTVQHAQPGESLRSIVQNMLAKEQANIVNLKDDADENGQKHTHHKRELQSLNKELDEAKKILKAKDSWTAEHEKCVNSAKARYDAISQQLIDAKDETMRKKTSIMQQEEECNQAKKGKQAKEDALNSKSDELSSQRNKCSNLEKKLDQFVQTSSASVQRATGQRQSLMRSIDVYKTHKQETDLFQKNFDDLLHESHRLYDEITLLFLQQERSN